MIYFKFIILIFLFSFSSVFPDNPELLLENSPSKKSNIGDIDSLINLINTNGWNNNLLRQYSRYLTNSEIDYEKEIHRLKTYPYSFQRTFLTSLIYKRQKKFKEMFDSLYSPIKLYMGENSKKLLRIDYLPYYDEIVFAANAAGLLNVLERRLPILKKRNAFYADYINVLIFYNKGKYQYSRSLLENLIKKDPASFFLMYRLSYVYRNLGDYQKALELLTGFGKKAGGIDNWDKAKLLLAEGSLYFLSGKNKKAYDLYSEGYNLSKKINDMEEASRALVNLGIIEDVEGKLDNSRQKFFSAIEIAKKINDIDAEALAYSELGVSYSFTNELIKAKQNYEKSYGLYTATGNQLRLSLLSNNLGTIYTQMFDYESALKYFQKGIEYAGENKRAVIKNLIGLADIYTNLSNYSKAIQLYNKAHEISNEIKEIALDAQINYGLGALNFGLNRYLDALKDFKNSYKLNNEENTYFSAQILTQMAVVYTKLDSLRNAELLFKKALNLSKKNNDFYSQALSCIDLASLYIKEDKIENAEITLSMVRGILRENEFKYLLSQSFLIEGKIFNSRNMFNKARTAFTKALDLGKELNEFDTQIEAYYSLAKLFHKNNLNEDAESFYKSAIKLIEDISHSMFGNDRIQISYYSSKEDIYNSFADFYLSQNEYVKAFELIDGSRSRNTMNNLVNLKMENLVKNDSLLKKIYDSEWILHSNVYGKKEVNKAKEKLANLKEMIIRKEPEIKKYFSSRKNLSLTKMQKKLKLKVNLISIYVTPQKTYLFLINKNNFYHFQIDITGKELKKMVSEISPHFYYSGYNSINFFNQDLFAFNAKAAYHLFNRLLKPAIDKINFGEKIIISTSPELLTLPFEFLISKYNTAESAYNYKNKDFLVLNYNISYIPSLALFFEQYQDVIPQNEKVLLVGDPLINNKLKGYAERRDLLEKQSKLSREIPLLPLKYSGEEINDIGKIIKANTILTDRNATESNFKNVASQNGIIHLSTHSFLFNKQPVIFFSNYYDSENDGFLEAGEIIRLKLKSDLVVLSSCNSGLGVIDESEGILGMTKAFFEAGAKSIVVSLWPVNDKYTAKFMTLFYENLSRGLDKSEALRQAKIEFIKNYSPDPYYWAPFVLSGNVSRINIETDYSVLPYIFEIIFIILIISFVIYFRKRKFAK